MGWATRCVGKLPKRTRLREDGRSANAERPAPAGSTPQRWQWTSYRCRLRPQAVDQSQGFREQPPWDRDLGKRESDVPTMANDLGADLDQLLAQRGHRPVLDLIGQRQRPEEVANVVCQHVQPETYLVFPETMAGQPRPVDGVVPFLEVLLGGAALIVEGDDALGRA